MTISKVTDSKTSEFKFYKVTPKKSEGMTAEQMINEVNKLKEQKGDEKE